MNATQMTDLMHTYKNGLLNDTLPFWLNHCIDRQDGGFMFALDRDGTILDTDKPVWLHGRFAWLLATIYRTVEQTTHWLELARHGIDFLLKHAFDDDGRMFFLLTKDGQPLRKRRYLFSEFFTLLAFAAYVKASGDEQIRHKTIELFDLTIKHLDTPNLLPPKIIPLTRPLKGLSMPMILLCTAQELRGVLDESICRRWIDQAIAEIEHDFCNEQHQCVLESVGPHGEFYNHFDGRLVNPGHGIEAAWFILHEATIRNDDTHLIELGCKMVDWCWAIGWDKDYGGMLYFRDALGLPATEYWHDMKFWWPQNETIIATLLAYCLTGNKKYEKWHKLAHQWAHDHFSDPHYGEWFGYLHRDGTCSSTIKGNMWKGPFHLPRMQWYCYQLLEHFKTFTSVR